jgi:hypothetical protein
VSARAHGGLLAVAGLAALFVPLQAARSRDAFGDQYRLVGAAPASVSAVSTSPTYAVYAVAGSGQPVGISASANASVVAGGTSNQLPTARIFRNGMEP